MNVCPPNQSSFTSASNLSNELEALDKAKELLAIVIVRSLDSDVFVGNSLVVLYTVCGNTNDAGAAFYNVGEKNVVSWNSVIVDVHSMVKVCWFSHSLSK
ncbi:hypothetical protein Gohar_010645 [Gossypium harknessii]|uniref:Uncharacterized protein n=1 Tax=Gossypium harknessii TaxID=34285 RepID=A0A7J9GRJ1_9ROSI|nr:hypothetical protein [Gossypium harknessii]